jgi:hypothetical protein
MKRATKQKILLALAITLIFSICSGLSWAIDNMGTPVSDSVDATSVKFHWTPYTGATVNFYRVYRNSVEVGSTISSTGYYNDFRLSPGTSYQYRVDAIGSDNTTVVAQSNTVTFTTTSSSTVKTQYKVLVVAFSPPSGFTTADRTHARNFVKYRMDFLRTASQNSITLEPFRVNPGDDPVIWIQNNPPLVPEGDNPDFVATVSTVYTEFGNKSIVDLIERGDIDTVWVVKCSVGGYGENSLVGLREIGNPALDYGKYFQLAAQVRCSRSFFIHDFMNDARVHDACAHMVEGVMTSICEAYPTLYPREYQYSVLSTNITDTTTTTTNLHVFERFRLADEWGGVGSYASRGNGNCGTSHFPPTARRDTDGTYDGDYAYYDKKSWQRYIDCGADEWFNYPTLTSAKRKLNGFDYGAFYNYQEGSSTFDADADFTFATDSYHWWWFNHIPHNAGVTNGKLNNWWYYLYDFNRFYGAAITYTLNGFPTIPTTFNPVNSEYGTEESTTNNWKYWHSCSDFGQGAQLSIVNSSNPLYVKHGNYSLKVDVTGESYNGSGRNDLSFPLSKNAHWNLAALTSLKLSIKPDLNPSLLTGANPVVRLCTNGTNRIEFVPKSAGVYANLFNGSGDANGWYNFTIPASGSTSWEKNIIGYVDPALTGTARTNALLQIQANVLANVNYIEVSVHSAADYGQSYSFYIDDIEFSLTSTQVALPTFSPASGTYSSAQSVAMSCATSGATIRYTTDASTPTSSSPVYSTPINVPSTATIKAYATKSGMTDSAVAAGDYTISTPGSIRVQMYNSNRSTLVTTIYPQFKLFNTGTNPINLSTVKIRYYYTIDGVNPQSFTCDYCPVGNNNVTGNFVSMGTPKTNADYYLEIGFTSNAGNLAAGASIEIQTRFNKTNWSNYTQTNDYSFNSTATGYVDWTYAPGYISNNLQWGVEP